MSDAMSDVLEIARLGLRGDGVADDRDALVADQALERLVLVCLGLALVTRTIAPLALNGFFRALDAVIPSALFMAQFVVQTLLLGMRHFALVALERRAVCGSLIYFLRCQHRAGRHGRRQR